MARRSSSANRIRQSTEAEKAICSVLRDTVHLLLTTTASLRKLNDWVGEEAAARGEQPMAPLVMDRFRPNIVLDDVEAPFVEDTWSTVRIGNIEFRFSRRALRPLRPDDDRPSDARSGTRAAANARSPPEA